jgi:protein AaeX
MRYEDMDLFGVYVTPFLPMLAAAAILCFPLLRAADRLGITRHVWHPALFNAAL